MNYQLSIEAIREWIGTLPVIGSLQSELAGLLQSPAQSLVGIAQASPMSLVGGLQLHVNSNKNDESM